MPSLSDTQTGFTAALIDAALAVPAGIISYKRTAPLKRFNVYRNNVYSSLIDVLEGRFPVVARLVGEEFFRATAKAFISDHPPVSPVLMRYGDGFADFLDRFEPVVDVPYLGDVARLEWCWNQAYHAADADSLTIEALQRVPADQAGGLVFTLHPSLHVVRSNWPVVTILAAHSEEGEPEPIDAGAGGEDALVIRPELAVEVRRLPAGGAAFIEALQEGASLEQAANCASPANPDFNLTQNLAGLFQSAAVIDIKTTQTEE